MSSSTPSEAVSHPAAFAVGIGCYNDAATIGRAVRAAADGLQRTGRTGCIVLADGGSSDETVQRAREAAGAVEVRVVEYRRPAVDVLRAPYHGLVGRPAAIRAVLREALAIGTPACLFFDGKLTSATAEWVARLLEPVAADTHDYVSPYYARHIFEGALTRSVVYPVFRALYGIRLRQPATGEFACSARFAEQVLNEPLWDAEDAQTGIDLWLASTAATGRFRVCEAAAGVRTRAPSLDAPDLTTTVAQVVGPLFTDIEARASAWHRIRGATAIPCIGPAFPGEPSAPALDVASMAEAFRLGYKALHDEWAWVVQPRTILRLKRLAESTPDQIRMADEQWAEIVFDFALAHRARTMARDHLLGCFTPLYLAWLAGFVTEIRTGTLTDHGQRPSADAHSPAGLGAAPSLPDGQGAPDGAEARLERLCLTFEMKKPYLIAGWRWPERFRA